MAKYYKSLQILRALAFLSIFFFHTTVLGDAFSRWSITVFLMLSGFLNVLHGYDNNISCDFKTSYKYAIRKIKGIYPLHLVMLAVAITLYYYSNRFELNSGIITELAKIVTNVLLISDWGPKRGPWLNVFSEYNIVTWYLSLSLLLFLLTPLFMQIMHKLYDSSKKTNWYLKPIIMIAIIYCITIAINCIAIQKLTPFEASIFIYESPLSRAGDYLIAMQMGYMFLNVNPNNDDADKSNRAMWITVGSVAVLASALFIYAGNILSSGKYSLIVSTGFYYTLPTLLLVYALAKLEDAIELTLANTKIAKSVVYIIVYLASISQYAYLIHVPVISAIHGVYKRFDDINLAIWSAVSFVITIGASMIVNILKKKSQKGI